MHKASLFILPDPCQVVDLIMGSFLPAQPYFASSGKEKQERNRKP